MVKDIYPGTSSYSDDVYTYGPYPNASQPTQLTAVDGTLFFVAQDEEHGAELWKSDGTAAGTALVADIAPGDSNSLSEKSALANANGVLLFVANDGVHGEELWRSDGTAVGTTLVKDITPGSGGNFADYGGPDFTVVDGTLFFSANDGTHGRELWKSDGTSAGTIMVKDISPGTEFYGTANSSYPFYLHDVDGKPCPARRR